MNPMVKRLSRMSGQYLMFLIVVSFVTTCCVSLFVSVMSSSMDITLTSENLELTAKMTFLNVLIISLLFMIVDTVRRRFTVDRPVKEIIDAGERITQGDFSVRIPERNSFFVDDNFYRIRDCFNHMAIELSGVETLRTDFISDVSHEMKTPLAVIQNYGTLLQTPDLPEERRIEYAKGVVNGSRRMSDMMTNILRLNRLENQRIFPQTKEFDLTEQVCDCMLQFENVWEERGIDVDVDVEEDIVVRADEELLGIVWNNLLSNAFKFTDYGGKVTLRTRSDDAYAYITVSDTGCGMTKEVGEHIFDKFYQGDASRSVEGNGLGLTLVKRVMDIVQGDMSVESSPGVGTTFTVRIGKVRSSDGTSR